MNPITGRTASNLTELISIFGFVFGGNTRMVKALSLACRGWTQARDNEKGCLLSFWTAVLRLLVYIYVVGEYGICSFQECDGKWEEGGNLVSVWRNAPSTRLLTLQAASLTRSRIDYDSSMPRVSSSSIVQFIFIHTRKQKRKLNFFGKINFFKKICFGVSCMNCISIWLRMALLVLN